MCHSFFSAKGQQHETIIYLENDQNLPVTRREEKKHRFLIQKHSKTSTTSNEMEVKTCRRGRKNLNSRRELMII